MRVALIGCSGIARSHIGGWKARPEAEMVFLCDVNTEAAEQVKAEGLVDTVIPLEKNKPRGAIVSFKGQTKRTKAPDGE